jgi:hypothetical protein
MIYLFIIPKNIQRCSTPLRKYYLALWEYKTQLFIFNNIIIKYSMRNTPMNEAIVARPARPARPSRPTRYEGGGLF